jgi:hypothetical protein
MLPLYMKIVNAVVSGLVLDLDSHEATSRSDIGSHEAGEAPASTEKRSLRGVSELDEGVGMARACFTVAVSIGAKNENAGSGTVQNVVTPAIQSGLTCYRCTAFLPDMIARQNT